MNTKMFGHIPIPAMVLSAAILCAAQEKTPPPGSIIIKGVRSKERLLDESALFLHRMVKQLPGKNYVLRT